MLEKWKKQKFCQYSFKSIYWWYEIYFVWNASIKNNWNIKNIIK